MINIRIHFTRSDLINGYLVEGEFDENRNNKMGFTMANPTQKQMDELKAQADNFILTKTTERLNATTETNNDE